MSVTKFCVIMPVYNVVDYVSKSIESVLKQTYKDFELIIIDDGSNDGSNDVCKKYEEKDKRIKMVRQKNGGLSSARNKGIDIAQGQYLLFLDSDDYLSDDNVLYEINNLIGCSDILIFDYYKLYESRKELVSCKRNNFSKELNNDRMKLIRYLVRNNIYKACAWSKCVKKELVDRIGLKFPVGYLNEDINWCAELLYYAKEIKYLNRECYVYRIGREGSITTEKNEKIIADRIDLIGHGVKKISSMENNEVILDYYAYEYTVCMGLLKLSNDKKIFDKVKELKYLLKYDINLKVKLVHCISRILGINGTIRVLGLYMRVKR